MCDTFGIFGDNYGLGLRVMLGTSVVDWLL